MTQIQHRNVAHRMLVVRQAGGGGGGVGNGAGAGNAGGGVIPDPPVSPPTTSPSPTSKDPPPPPPPSSTPTPTSPPPKTSKTTPTPTPPPPSPSSSPPPANTPSSKSTSSSSSSGSSSSSSSSSSSIVSIPPAALNTNKAIANTPTQGGLLPTSSFGNVTPTNVDSAGTTVVADPIQTTGAAKMSTGSIVGIVAGTLIGLTIIGFLSLYILRRLKRNQRYGRHESDFGTFNRSAFIREKEPPVLPDMAERGHTVAPSLTNEQAAGIATPPSQALAAANAAAAAAAAGPVAPLQERPKYVFGQIPAPTHDNASDDDVSDVANGVYSSEPQAQMAYNAEAYGSYARYDDAGQGVVGGVGVAVGGGYQDAQREYQGQQGYYDQNGQEAYYDQNQQQGYYDQQHQQGYAVGYDQQAQYAEGQYDYSQQHEQYAQQQPQEQEASAYQPPHPYANGAVAGGKAAYGGM
ncbi:hypothetical protein GALMADRAFT_222460 [Galerina marginata CBS 339.88]|uniref:Mid2 domain-containing protein n=1 Tax=Galerina marginata (strain CBS 339.88) TaxID=685588 RepID=A0A067TET7_GALM3|nr:hypothetical protein GALMADRAFT_222460 [Galerina marginata CBS 339.88]